MKKEGNKWTRKKNTLLPSMCYAGHRQLLPMTHWLRMFGQSGKCCPKGYYDNKLDVVSKSFCDEEAMKKNPESISKCLDYEQVADIEQKCCGEENIEFGTKIDTFDEPIVF